MPTIKMNKFSKVSAFKSGNRNIGLQSLREEKSEASPAVLPDFWQESLSTLQSRQVKSMADLTELSSWR